MIVYSTDHTVDNLFDNVQIAYKGNLHTPTQGTDKWTIMLTLANRFQMQYANDANNRWKAMYTVLNTTTPTIIAAGTQSYQIASNVHALAEYVYVNLTDGTQAAFTVIRPEEVPVYRTANTFAAPQNYNYATNTVYLSGSNPKSITFLKPITTQTNLVGGTIVYPCYTRPAQLTAATDVITVTNNRWLVYAMAAELARNDPAKKDQYAYLQGLANDEYERMVSNNQSNSFLQPNAVDIAMPMPGQSW